MVLNSEFWEALTGNQRRKFAKANCEATYKKAIIYQIIAAILGVLVIGLFLPIGDKARRYFKGYYSLREDEMPLAVKILCVLDFIFGLFASLVIMMTADEDDYGLFVNTLSRKKLEEMLNESETAAAVVGVGDDPFRIGGAEPVLKKREPKPARRGCEKLDAAWLVVINAATVILAIAAISLIFSSCSSDNGDVNSVPSVDITQSSQSSVVLPTKDDFGELSRYPNQISEPIEMKVDNTDNGLRLRNGPSTDSEIILTMPNNSKLLVYSRDEVKDWYFVAYTQEGKTVYGWACAVISGEQYIFEIESSSSEQASSTASVSEATLTNDEVKAAVINHVKAVNDAENGFVGYLKLSESRDESGSLTETLSFGSAGEPAVYIKATNAKSIADLNKYLSNYMITSLANEKSKLATVTGTAEAQTEKSIYYDDGNKSGIYVHSEATSFAGLDASSISVLSSSANAYIVTAKASFDSEEINYTITFQYKDGKFMISAYTVS